jgi:hypothetical protein
VPAAPVRGATLDTLDLFDLSVGLLLLGAPYNIRHTEADMGMRAVRLDEESERRLAELREATGLSVSEILKRGISSLAAEVDASKPRPYDVFRSIDLGPGGYARAPAREAKQAIRRLLREKARR